MAEPKLTCDICHAALPPNKLRIIFIGFTSSERNLLGIPGEKFRACSLCRDYILDLIKMRRDYFGFFGENNCETDGAVEDEQAAETAVEEHEEEQ